MSLEKFLILSKAVLCLSVAATALIVFPFVVNYQLTALRSSATIEIDQTRKETIALVDRRMDSLQGNVDGWIKITDNRLSSLEGNTYGLAASLRKDTFSAIADTRKDMFGALVTVKADAFTRIDTLSLNIDKQLTKTNESISTVTTAYADIPVVVGARFDKQTDCSKNALCWQNLTTDTLTNLRYTGRDFSIASQTFTAGFPTILDNSTKITANFAGITSNINKLTTPHWYDRVLGYAVNGAILYSTMNPVTNIGVTVAKVVSSQK